jgi:hypothetical protein
VELIAWSAVLGVLVALAAVAFAPDLRRTVAAPFRGLWRHRRRRSSRFGRSLSAKELAAEERAEELMEAVVGGGGLEAYRALGFLHVFGAAEEDGRPGYGYLIYPHRPIVSFDARSGHLLNELCVRFPDRESPEQGERLPDADDALAKWMALRGDEEGLLSRANVHPPGHQVDPAQARRDLVRLEEWTASPSDASASGGFATAP